MLYKMKSLLLFTCLLSGLVSFGYSLSCMHCQTEGELSCTGDEKKCPSENYACAATSTISIIEGVARKTFSRSCEKRSSCGIFGTIGYLKGKVKTATSCCYADSCTPSSPALPVDNSQRVGLTCSSCTSQDSTWCHTGETIECTGEEKRCLFQATTTSGPKQRKSSVRGCASKSLCDIGSQSHDFGNGIKCIQVTRKKPFIQKNIDLDQ
uniref:UPAR/Ly6 domain-containing protein n=1 Tax=Leptobrachium leishanense TaxID=445787 RepID=A0A8C5PZJ1_9ANUR